MVAWALVKWISEERISVISTSWIVKPPTLDNIDFPVLGSCYWKRKNILYDTEILEVSEDKAELERKISSYCDNLIELDGEEDHGLENAYDLSLELDEDYLSAATSKKRKAAEDKENRLAKKRAETAATEDMTKKIFTYQFPSSCKNCTDLKEKVEERDLMIRQLQNEVQMERRKCSRLRRELQDLKSMLATVKKKPGMHPIPTTASLKYLKDLVSYFDGNNQSTSESEESDTFDELEEDMLSPSYDRQAVVGLDNTDHIKSLLAPVPNKEDTESASDMPTLKSGKYTYKITPDDLRLEQQAFEPGEGKRELVDGLGVHIKFIDLQQAEQSSKNTPTGLMRALISVWYSRRRLAACSATSGINQRIRTSVFKYCEIKYSNITVDKLKRDLTSKCGEERRKIMKDTTDVKYLIKASYT